MAQSAKRKKVIQKCCGAEVPTPLNFIKKKNYSHRAQRALREIDK